MHEKPETLKLYLLRHGEAGVRKTDMDKDEDRTLTPSGRQDISAIAGFLKSRDLTFDVIASSPLKRAEETAAIVAKKLRLSKRLEKWNELDPTCEPGMLLARLSSFATGSTILVVGHEPQLSSVIGETTSGGSMRLALKKGGLAKVDVDVFRPKVSGELQLLLTPKFYRKASR